VRKDDIPVDSNLKVLVDSPESGLCLLEDPKHRALHMFNHVEYDTTSLADEYFRDIQLQPDTPVPANYFPSDDASRKPQNCWRGHAHLLFGNWINEMYQSTPYDLAKIGKPD
jgi:homoserine O-succinyltransferase